MENKHLRFPNLGPASVTLGLLAMMSGLAACSADAPPATGNPYALGQAPGAVPGQSVTPGVAPAPMVVGVVPVIPGANPAAPAQPVTPLPGAPATDPLAPADPSVPAGVIPDPSAPPVADGEATRPMPPGPGTPSEPAAMPGVTPAATPAVPAEMAPASGAVEPAPEPEPAAAGGTGNDLVPNNDGWVGPTTNGVGVEGAWYTYDDEETTGLALAVADGVACVSGTSDAMEDPETDWGAGLGFSLKDEAIWDGSAYSGFSFTASITSDTDVSVELKMQGVDASHAATIKAGSNTISWSDVAQPDWVTAADAEAFDESKLLALQFKIPRTDAGTNAFEVCISNLSVD